MNRFLVLKWKITVFLVKIKLCPLITDHRMMVYGWTPSDVPLFEFQCLGRNQKSPDKTGWTPDVENNAVIGS